MAALFCSSCGVKIKKPADGNSGIVGQAGTNKEGKEIIACIEYDCRKSFYDSVEEGVSHLVYTPWRYVVYSFFIDLLWKLEWYRKRAISKRAEKAIESAAKYERELLARREV